MSDHRPNLMRGYERTPEMANDLIDALTAAILAHPTERLGQLLDNALGREYNIRLVFDEAVIAALQLRDSQRDKP